MPSTRPPKSESQNMPAKAPTNKRQDAGMSMNADDTLLLPTREVLKPDNQLDLSEKELDEEIAKMLTANNPAAPKNIARYDQKLRTFKFEPMVDMNMVHYTTDGWLLHNTSDEAKKQNDLQKLEAELTAKFQAELAAAAEKESAGESSEPPDDSKQLRNSFNYSDRAAQTFNAGSKERETMTEPPPTATREGSCSQYEIYDEYVQDQRRIKHEEEVQKAKTAKNKAGKAAVQETPGPPVQEEQQNLFEGESISRALQVLERTVNQNSFNDIAQDFKYWDDASDQFREGEGTLLPLWKFFTDKAKKKHITCICWNPEYLDMFAVSYGSYDFMKQGSGLVCIYSLKNPSHPEFTFQTDSGVMCCDFHKEKSNLLAVGLYDGTVMVYDIRNKSSAPIYRSTVKTGKHTDPVWQVFWAEDEAGKPQSFLSVSSDGRVTMWMLSKSMLEYQDVLELKIERDEPPAQTGAGSGGGGRADEGEEGAEEAALGALASGCSFDFHKETPHLFVVGTEEGYIHKCSTAYNSQYLQSYDGHQMAVYSLKWNHLHTDVFLSASADWTVKLWDAKSPKSIMTFDLNNSVGDVAWAPYSSTVFAAITADGKVNVFDLNENKHEPMCEQKVVRKAKLTKIAFNPKYPVILVGDDRGCVTSLKLSPNLRKTSAPYQDPDTGKTVDNKSQEVKKLDAIIEIALKSVSPEEPEASPTAASAP